jgi:hypothetical protein
MDKEELMNEINGLKENFKFEKDKFDQVLKPRFDKPFSWRYDEDYLNPLVAPKGLGDEIYDLIKTNLNQLMRGQRLNKYKNLKSGNARIIAEGDSWFSHPFLHDIIDCLYDDSYAVFAFSEAGDSLMNMAFQSEFLDAVKNESPLCFLLSAGGNDLLDSKFLDLLVSPEAEDLYKKDLLQEKINELHANIMAILDRIHALNPGLPLFMHGYDYIVPRRDAVFSWVYPVLVRKGIYNPLDQQKIIKNIIDAYNDDLWEISVKHQGQFFHVDLRNTILSQDEWYDEIHPTSRSFKDITEKITTAILSM